MGTLWIFGDSFSANFQPTALVDWRDKYINWKGYIPKVYGEIIAETFQLQLKNLSVGGNDNYTIFQTFCDNVEYIKNNDIVIIGWTSYCRFRLTDKNNWQQILPTVDFKIDGISKQTIDEIFINRESSGKYVDEINSWIKLINLYLKNNKVIHWNWDGLSYDTKINGYHLNKFETIYKETNGVINDIHYSESGHKDLAEFFINKITSHKLI